MKTNYTALLGLLAAPMLLLAAPMLMFAAGASPDLPTLPPTSGPATNLEARVLHELRMLPYYSVFDDLSFHVDGSVVTLTGEVTEPVKKTDAESVVKRLPGVTQVNDEIEALPLSSFDRQIRMKTYFAIYGFGPLQRYGLGTFPSIHILVKNSHVTLKGVVDSEADRNLVYIRANQVPGVFSVTNELLVDKHS